MLTNTRSISEISPSATPEIGDSEAQGTLPVGPTGRVHRGGGTVPWAKRLALTTAPSPTSHHVLLTLGSFVSDAQSDAWPSVATLASMTGLSRRAVQTALRALEGAHLVTTETVSGRASRYRLACAPAAPPPAHLLRPPCAPAAPEVLSEGTSTRKAAAATTVRTQVQPTEVRPPALPLLHVQKTGQKEPRHTCGCGHTWPESFGVTCFKCQTRVGSSHPAGGAAPVPGKYDCLYDDTPRPDPPPPPAPPPMKTETRLELEADARSRGYTMVAGRWMRWSTRGEPDLLAVPDVHRQKLPGHARTQ